MKHSYLLEEGLWRAEGTYIDAEGNAARVQGFSRIRHAGKTWVNEGEMTVESDPPVTFNNRYRITPVAAGADTTCWVSENPVLGRLNGNFAFVGDTLLSVYQTADGRYRGTEALIRVDEVRYQGRGALFDDETRLSSWYVELTRAE